MLLGRVKGNAVCTIKYPGTEGLKLLIVQPLDRHLNPQWGLAGSRGCRPGGGG
jgi:ethanolamine utilization protein EutN